MLEGMARLHITEAELARDVHAVLDKVRQGAEIVIEQDHSPNSSAAVGYATPPQNFRSVGANAKNSTAIMDESFARDMQAAIESHREPLDGSSWD
jgi:hypothetical protein